MTAVDQHVAVQEHLTALADRLEQRHHELTGRLFEEMSSRIPELPHDPLLLDLLRASVASNLENVVHFLRGHLDAEDVPVPPAAAEYARRLAQRDAPPSALLRAYRLGQMAVLTWARETSAELVDDQAFELLATHAVTDATFVYIDAVSEGVVTTYQHERDQWLANRDTVKRETVDNLLGDGPVDVDAAERALGHRLRHHHVGVLLWVPDRSAGTAGPSKLEHHLAAFARALGLAGAPLFVAQDRALGWGWLPVAPTELDGFDRRLATLPVAGDVALAVGTPAEGPEGFRATHEEAQAAHRVALLGRPDTRLTRYAAPGVRAAALLAGDLPGTRRMVRRTLGGLAGDTDSIARLRDTLLVFLEERHSYVATAARLHLHKNTVRYRVERALQLRGRPLEDDRLDLELALHACARLGNHVLVPAS